MRKTILRAGLVLIVLVLSTLPPGSASAQSGCCKTRSGPDQDWKKALDLTFERCRQLNEQRDGDDVFVAKGLVWWDKDCR